MNALALACLLAKRNKGKVYAVYVIEVARTLPLDADLSPEAREGEEILARAEQVADALDFEVTGELLQARDAGHAIVDEAIQRGEERDAVKVLIMGCGRVGAELAAMLDQEEHEVTVLDRNPDAFRRLPPEFGGHRVVGNGIDQEVLARIGVAEMDAFVSVTQGDHRNVMAAQMAKHLFGVQRVVCRIYAPIREELYHELGLETISPTKVGARLLKEALEREPAASGSGD